jgi:hypothetical protein
MTARSSRRLGFPALVVAAASASCLSVQDFGATKEAAPPATTETPPALSPATPADGTWRWEWINPAPTGKTLHGIGGTSDSDLWVAGEGGNIAHFDGAGWDIRHVGRATTRYFSVGARSASDVWVAGTTEGQISVVHFDGRDWVDSYPFAGGAFRGFSHGAGKRLFAVVDWDILELSAAGTWEPTDTRDNGVFGPPAGVWVASSGEAWALTTGAKLLKLPAASQKWQLQGPVAGVSPQAVGLALSGAGAQACAFYTGRPSGAGGGGGFMHYDGSAWTAGPPSPELLPIDTEAHGSKSACLADGTGLFVDGDRVVSASVTVAPSARMPTDFEGERLLGALSLDGTKAYAVGSFGAFMTRASGATGWQERGPTVRKDLLGVDVGLDGTVMLVDALQPDRRAGGEVLVWQDGALARRTGKGFAPPDLPIAVTVVGKDDAWVVSDPGGRLGVTHWTGSWGVTRTLEAQVSLGGTDALAIWAPAKDDVWVTGQSHCPDLAPLPNGACSKPSSGFAWHYDGAKWASIAVDAVYRSIHGTGPGDIWFAGDGVAHWDGTTLTAVPSLKGTFAGVWSSAKDRVWLWGDRALSFDGKTSTPIKTALNAAADWTVLGIAESVAGDVFVLTKRGTGTSLLWFDPSRTRLVEQVESDRELSQIRGRGDQLWTVGAGGAALRFAPPPLR